jgi:hypothetical protein
MIVDFPWLVWYTYQPGMVAVFGLENFCLALSVTRALRELDGHLEVIGGQPVQAL